MPQNKKLSNRFWTGFVSAVVCQTFKVPYTYKMPRTRDDVERGENVELQPLTNMNSIGENENNNQKGNHEVTNTNIFRWEIHDLNKDRWI